MSGLWHPTRHRVFKFAGLWYWLCRLCPATRTGWSQPVSLAELEAHVREEHKV